MKVAGIIYGLSGLALILVVLAALFDNGAHIGTFVWGTVALALLLQSRSLLLQQFKARIGAIVSSLVIAVGFSYSTYLLIAPNYFSVPKEMRMIVCSLVVIASVHFLALLLLLRAKSSAP